MRLLSFAELAATAVSVPPALAGGYLGALALLGRRDVRRDVRRDGGVDFVPFIAIVVPAHDEEAGVAATIQSLLATEYPADRRRVVVVADNCTDATAEVARAAGAHVIERIEPEFRGKGYALALAFSQLLDGPNACPAVDAIAVVDADTLVSPNLLREMAEAFGRGASAVQADYGVRHAEASWRTRLLVIAFAAFHGARSLGRERLGLSCGLRGTGMGFTSAVLREVPQRAAGLVEDIEHGIELGLAGHRVWYLHDAHVWGEMPATATASQSQRDRWERGRRQLVTQWAPRLLHRASRDRVSADLLIDLLVPPLGQLALVLLSTTGAAAAVTALGGNSIALVISATGILGVVTYVAKGWQLSGTGAQGLLDLAMAPAYVAWKVGAKAAERLRSHQSPEAWVRTTRAANTVPEGAP